MTENRDTTNNREADARPTNILVDHDHISLDFDGLRLVGLIERFSWHVVLVRLVAPIDLPERISREIKYHCPAPEQRFSLFDEAGRELPKLSPLGIESAANLVVNLWIASRTALTYRDRIRAVYEPIKAGLALAQERDREGRAELRRGLREGRLSPQRVQDGSKRQTKATNQAISHYNNDMTRVWQELAPIMPPSVHPELVIRCWNALEHD
ncbi:MAG TPA: hypothetical protein PKH54_03760 [Myxococcota bacterium]|nr:hypothetical protein [Myxococcota bacterium]